MQQANTAMSQVFDFLRNVVLWEEDDSITVSLLYSNQHNAAVGEMPLQYPLSRRDDTVVDDYHGVQIPDPYRWLEDPDAEEVKDFVQKQVNLTEAVLKTYDTRERLREHITKLFDNPRFETPFKQGDKYFYFHNTGLQAQSVLYMQDSLDGEAEVLLDPNVLSDDGTVALSTASVSEDAKYFAYGLSSSGSDWVTIKVMRVEDKVAEPDTLSWVKFSSINWTHDSQGFFYSRYPAPKEGKELDAGTETNSNLNHELYYHFMGTDQSEDILCWKDPENPKYMFDANVMDDGKFSGGLDSETMRTFEEIRQCVPVNVGGSRELLAGIASS